MSEQGKWHHRVTLEEVTGVARTTVTKNKDGSDNLSRKPTVRDARKFGFLPSVTSIIRDVYAPNRQLTKWVRDSIIKATIKTPFPSIVDGKFDEAFERYAEQVQEVADEYKNATADRGKELHGIINRFILGGEDKPDDPIGRAIIEQTKAYFASRGVISYTGEQPIGRADRGFAGTPDIIAAKDGGIIIIDLKTTDLFDSKGKQRMVDEDDLYDEWKAQTGGYAILVDNPNTSLVELVADRKTGKCVFIEYAETKLHSEMFMHMYELFVIKNKYDPRKFNTAKEEENGKD
jgi:hypothetical protein